MIGLYRIVKLRLYLILVVFGVIITVKINGQSLDRSQIKKAAQQFASAYDLSIDEISSDKHFPHLYIVRFRPTGFLILSSDRNAPPVLAYSFSDTFLLPVAKETAVFARLRGYSAQVDALSGQKFYNVSNQQDWENLLQGNLSKWQNKGKNVAALTTSNWALANPWNAGCPPDPNGSGGHARVGCLAVAMGQIMYYWKYPAQGNGCHEYMSNYGLLSADFGNTFYDFDAMLDTQATAATTQLLYHCGVAVDMHYGPAVSYAWSYAAIPALINYFRYKDNCEMLHQSNFTDFEWNVILHNELDAHRPVYFEGFSQSATTGHGFICDGYQNDYYHFNWGLGGSYNGYYYLDDLTPGNANFSYHQGIIRKIEPRFNFIHDLSIDKIIAPHSDYYLSSDENVRFRIRNDGSVTENSFSVRLVVNQTDMITENCTQTILPGESIAFSFSQTLDLSAIGNYQLRFEVLLPTDEYTYNNVFTVPVVCSELNLCTPQYVTACSEGDYLQHLQLLNFLPDNEACGSLDANGYSQYLNLSPATLTLDSSYTLSIMSGHNHDYVSLWIDKNDDASFDTAECFIDNLWLEDANVSYTSSVLLPRDMNPGRHVMRLRSRRDTLADDPCSLYAFGETEDYFVNIRDYCRKPYRFFDDFENYTSGTYVACQNPEDWTTWTQNPCSMDDAIVSSAQAYSGTQSLLILQGDDFVHPIDNFKSGIYEVVFQLFIPAGKVAYFNTLLKFNGDGSAWGQEVHFENGIANMDASGDNAAQFPYPSGQWFESKLRVNLDIDSAYYYCDGQFVYAWKWSNGAHDTDVLDQLGGTNFWGWTGANGNASCYFFVDDYEVRHIFEKPEPVARLQLSYAEHYQHIHLDWDYPDSLWFVIFRADEDMLFAPVDTVSGFSYTDSLVAEGIHNYYVKVLCDSLLSDKSNIVQGTIAKRLSLRAFLEGPYDSASHRMHNHLREAGYIPLQQPFGAAPWFFNANDGLNVIPEEMVDWVLVKLYDTTAVELLSDECVMDTLSAVMLSNGKIVPRNGIDPLIINQEVHNQLFVEVLVRNHLPLISALPLALAGNEYAYDFTLSAAATYGVNAKNLGDGYFGMPAGDANADGVVDGDDLFIWSSEAGEKGYLQSDFNLDTQSDNVDKNQYWLENK